MSAKWAVCASDVFKTWGHVTITSTYCHVLYSLHPFLTTLLQLLSALIGLGTQLLMAGRDRMGPTK